jgi:predicted small lipoprotein YifL
MRNLGLPVVACLVALTACGQKGPLVLPDAQHPHKHLGIGKPSGPQAPNSPAPEGASPPDGTGTAPPNGSATDTRTPQPPVTEPAPSPTPSQP